MRGSHMPMYTHDRSRRRKGVNVAEIVAGVLGVILLVAVAILKNRYDFFVPFFGG